MINYNVQPGDMLGVLAVKYQTTIKTLMSDNPIIPSTQKLTPGWILKIYTPQENVERNADSSYASIETVHAIESQIKTSDYFTATPKSPVYYKNRAVSEGVVAFIRTTEATSLYQLEFDGFIKFIRDVSVGEIFGVYQTATLGGDPAFVVEGYYWLYDNPSLIFDPIPLDVLAGAISFGELATIDTGKMMASVVNATSFAGFGPAQTPLSSLKITPVSFVGSGPKRATQSIYDVNTTMPIFQQPAYRRPLMQLTNAAGQTTRIELRLTGFSANYANTVTPQATNAGWMVNVRAPELPMLNIVGYLLETAASNEFNDFMARYHQYLESSKSGDFYSMGISVLTYKSTEYRGVITAFSYSDNPNAPLHREYNMQMLVLKEKTLNSTQIANLPTVVSRKGFASETDFRSDIASMLANPITGALSDKFFG